MPKRLGHNVKVQLLQPGCVAVNRHAACDKDHNIAGVGCCKIRPGQEATLRVVNCCLTQGLIDGMMKPLKINGRWVALVVGLLGTQAACQGASASAMPDFATARAQFEAGRAGSAEATEMAQRLFARLLSSDANNPLYLVYYGSTFTLQARNARAPWTKIKLVNQGVSILDRALALLNRSPGSSGAGTAVLETRLVAMATFIALPETFFHRLAAAKHEFQLAVGSPGYSSAPVDLRGHLQYEGALIARQEGDAVGERAALQRVLALAPPSIDMAEVRARLGELR